MTPEDFLVVAQVLGPHGVRGELKCRLVTDFPDRFKRGTRVYVGSPPGEHRIAAARVSGRLVYLKIVGIGERATVDALRGSDVLVAVEDAMPLPEGQFYWRDVVGLRVEDTHGRHLGEVVDILATGANDVYVVRGDLGEILVPAIKDVVKAIAPAEGRMVVDPLPGMLPEPRPARRRSYGRPRSGPGRVPAKQMGESAAGF